MIARPRSCLQAGVVPCLELLLEDGASVNVSSRQGTPLLWAIGSSQEACTSFLLEHGADVNATDDSHISPALLAAATGLPPTCPSPNICRRKGGPRLLR